MCGNGELLGEIGEENILVLARSFKKKAQKSSKVIISQEHLDFFETFPSATKNLFISVASGENSSLLEMDNNDFGQLGHAKETRKKRYLYRDRNKKNYIPVLKLKNFFFNFRTHPQFGKLRD